MKQIEKLRLPETARRESLRTDLIRHIAEHGSGSLQDLIRHMMALHPEENAETLRKKIRDFDEHLRYLRISDRSREDPEWHSTPEAEEQARLLREPTFVDSIKGWWLRHILGFRIDL
ncbi:MAG: hypothetical protein HGA31_03100 [Candidatus Moranbacteria bacterium]|nr:hypothetical protein [Candidatus Moranbacteria bacterium]